MAIASIAIVSDLHAGDTNPYGELRTSAPESIRSRFLSVAALATAFSDVLQETPPARRYMICAGDLSSRCHSQELRLAARFLEELASRLEVPTQQRGLVPGNHDIDWNLTSLAIRENDSWYDDLRQEKFKQVLQTHSPSFTFPFNGTPVLIGGSGTPLDIVLLDSPFQDRSNTQPHHGQLGISQLNALSTVLAASSAERPSVVVLHHHVTAMGRNIDDPDFSLLQDAEDLLAQTAQADVRLILHGHQHRAHLTELPHPGALAVVLGAGSTAVPLPHLPPEVLHTLHVVHFDAIDGQTVRGRIVTRVLSVTHGWHAPLLTRDRIEHIRPFGGNISPSTVHEWAALAIDKCGQEGLVKLHKFLPAQPGGSSVSLNDFVTVLRRQLAQRADANRFELLEDHAHDSYQLQLV